MSATLDHTSVPLLRPLSCYDTVWQRIVDVARSIPDGPAVVTWTGSITFAELVKRGGRRAHTIMSMVSDPNRPIAVDVESTIDSVVLALAVFASKHPLVAIDTFIPHERRRQIIDAAGAVSLSVDQLDARAYDSATINSPDIDSPDIDLPDIRSTDTAMIAFTSGSSGTPKAVVLSQRMSVTKAFDVGTALELQDDDVLGNALPLSFGAGITTLLAGILNAIPVACWDPRSDGLDQLPSWLGSVDASTLHCTPSLLRQIGTPPSSVRLVVCYGEALHSNDIRTLRQDAANKIDFVNWYATTEAGMVAYSRHHAGSVVTSGFLPAGRPLPHKIVEVVGPNGTPVAHGQIGEIRVTSDVLADGYLGMPKATRAKFTAHSTHGRTYSTGDLGRIDDRGNLHLTGRLDSTVKINGYLVGPTEVEAALLSLTDVYEAVVLPRTVHSGSELVAYISTRSHRPLTDVAVRAGLRELLPEWMIPRHIIALAALPRTDRGKVDRTLLPPPPERHVANHAVGPTEWIAADIAKRVLHIDTVGREEDFQSLGGDSLSAIQTIVEVRKLLGIELEVSDLMRGRNVRQLAELLDEKLNADASHKRSRSRGLNSILVPIKSAGTKNPLFIVTGAGVPATALLLLGARLDAERPVFGLQAKGLERRALPDRTVRAAAARYVREIRAVQPSGPYLLAGHSMGGWIALEMAKILQEQGHTVERLIIIDTRLYRRIIDTIPAMRELPAAPEPSRLDASGLALSRFTELAMWPRIFGAGLLQYGRTTHWLVFASVGYRAMRHHTPTPWTGPLLAIRTESNVADPRTWAALATGELDIHTIAGSHSDLTREPAVSTLADIIDKALAQS